MHPVVQVHHTHSFPLQYFQVVYDRPYAVYIHVNSCNILSRHMIARHQICENWILLQTVVNLRMLIFVLPALVFSLVAVSSVRLVLLLLMLLLLSLMSVLPLLLLTANMSVRILSVLGHTNFSTPLPMNPEPRSIPALIALQICKHEHANAAC